MGNAASIKEDTPGELRRNESDASMKLVIDNSTVIGSRSSNFDAELVCIPKIKEDKALISKSVQEMFLFQAMDRANLRKIVDCFAPVDCQAGESIIKEGDHGDFMYIVDSGKFEVSKEGQGKISECERGSKFGELALLYNATRAATVTCIEAGKLWSLDRNSFRLFQQEAKASSQGIIKILGSVPLLKDLNLSQLSIVRDVARATEYKQGDTIIKQGEVGDVFYIILDGMVTVTSEGAPSPASGLVGRGRSRNFSTDKESESIPPRKVVEAQTDQREATNSSGSIGSQRSARFSSADDPSQLLTPSFESSRVTLKVGDWFGEIALLTGSVRTATVTVQSPYVTLLEFDREVCEKALGSLRDIIDKQANYRMLSVLPIIANLEDRYEEAIDMFSIKHFKCGEVIAQCGDTDPCFVVVKSGKACIWQHPNPVELALQMTSPKGTASRKAMDDYQEFPTSLPTNGNSKNQGGAHSKRASVSSFQSLEDFQLCLSPKVKKAEEKMLFENTPLGKKEHQWRSTTLDVINHWTKCTVNTKMKKLAKNSEHGVAAAMRRSRDYSKTSSADLEEIKDEVESEVENKGSPVTAKYNEADMEYSGILETGGNAGAEAVANGTPMDCTIIASEGDVSCFILTRNDWLVLFEENYEEDYFESVTPSAKSSSRKQGAAIEALRSASLSTPGSLNTIPSINENTVETSGSTLPQTISETNSAINVETGIVVVDGKNDLNEVRKDESRREDKQEEAKDSTPLQTQSVQEDSSANSSIAAKEISSSESKSVQKTLETESVPSVTDQLAESQHYSEPSEPPPHRVSNPSMASTKSRNSIGGSFDMQRPPEQKVDWDQLTSIKRLGAGTFGTVYMMKDKSTDLNYALKVIEKKKVKKKKHQEMRVKSELAIMLAIRSQFICQCFGMQEDDQGYYLLLEMISGGELKQIIHPPGEEKQVQYQQACRGQMMGIPLQAAKFYTAAIALPLIYLHRRGIVYRDLKPENVMIEEDGYPKLVDFGVSKQLDPANPKTYTLCGTPEYLAPEVILGEGHSQAVDWWALGVLLYDMVVGVTPFIDRTKQRGKQDQLMVFESIVKNHVIYPRALPEDCKDLIQRLLTSKPALRMGCGRWTFKEFEQHEWFDDGSTAIDWYALNRKKMTPPSAKHRSMQV